MENPKQSTYAPEELFLLKPDVDVVAKPETPATSDNNISPPAVPLPPINKSGFWENNKWYIIIGGIILIGSISLLIYHEKQKKKKNQPKN